QLVTKGLPQVAVTPAAMELLARYPWPGNVRELRNVLEQMVVLGNAEHVIDDRIIAQALRLSGGNKKEAARLLRVNRTTLLEKLKRKRAQGSPLAMLLGPPRLPESVVPE